MSLPGLVRAKNLGDVEDKEKAWDNLGNGISYTINGNTSTSVVIKGKDILALERIAELDIKEIIYLAGLASPAQPRLTTIATNTNTAVQLEQAALLKASPTTTGNFQVNGAVSFTNLRVNGVGIKSLSSSPFSGGNALSPIHLGGIVMDTGFKLNLSPIAGSLSNPELAIPIESNGMLFYLRAGQS